MHLNKTVDVAEECLKGQGRSIDNPSHEVSMMFLRHCPDESLSGIFKLKSAEKWNASEIQERLDEYMQNKKALKAVQSQRRGVREHTVYSQSFSPSLNSPCSGAPLTSTPAHEQPGHAAADSDCMRSLVQLLDKLVTQQTQMQFQTPRHNPSQPVPCKVCRVCGATNHSTLSHCRRENLCLGCLSSGHWKKNCPLRGVPQSQSPKGGSEAHNQQLN